MIVFPGTFDPMTVGHVRLVERALAIFDRVIVAVAQQAPGALFDFDQRLAMAKAVWQDHDRVIIKPMPGLMVDFMREESCHLVLRGLRNSTDFAYEQHLEAANARLNDELEWCYLATEPAMMGVSSSIVRQIIHEQGDLTAFVPKAIRLLMQQWGESNGVNDH